MFDDIVRKPLKPLDKGIEAKYYHGKQAGQKVTVDFKKKTVKFDGGWELYEFTEICKQICEDLGDNAPFEYTPHNDWYILKPDFSAFNCWHLYSGQKVTVDWKKRAITW